MHFCKAMAVHQVLPGERVETAVCLRPGMHALRLAGALLHRQTLRRGSAAVFTQDGIELTPPHQHDDLSMEFIVPGVGLLRP